MSLNNVLLQNGEKQQRRFTANQSLNHIQLDHRTSIPRQRSYDNMTTSTEANVLVIYTGGTIGMTRNRNNGEWFLFEIFFKVNKFKPYQSRIESNFSTFLID